MYTNSQPCPGGSHTAAAQAALTLDWASVAVCSAASKVAAYANYLRPKSTSAIEFIDSKHRQIVLQTHFLAA